MYCSSIGGCVFWSSTTRACIGACTGQVSARQLLCWNPPQIWSAASAASTGHRQTKEIRPRHLHKYVFGSITNTQALVDHMYRWKLEVLLNSWNPYNYFCFKYSLDDSKAHDGLSLLSWQFWDTFCPQCSIHFGIGMLQRKLTFVIPQTNKTRWKWDNSPPHWFPKQLIKDLISKFMLV